MARRQHEKSLETKEELLESAISLFSLNGFELTTVSKITEKAGYAKGNFYRYWKSKDDIFLEIMEEKLRGYREGRDDLFDNAITLSDATGIITNFLEAILDDGNWAKNFLEFTIHASKNNNLKKELNKSIYRLSSDLFAEIMSPFQNDGYSMKKKGGFVTALFEGYLIQTILESNVIDKKDLKFIIEKIIQI